MKNIGPSFLFLIFALPVIAFADGVAVGSDMWTAWMDKEGLFSPHIDYCDSSTEAFIAVEPGGVKGFCMEKDQRGYTTWEEARATCVGLRKRLPEPGEFRYACTRAASLGLDDMITANGEFSSNFPITFYSGSPWGITVSYSGMVNCNYSAHSWVTNSNGSSESHNYRCVR